MSGDGQGPPSRQPRGSRCVLVFSPLCAALLAAACAQPQSPDALMATAAHTLGGAFPERRVLSATLRLLRDLGLLNEVRQGQSLTYSLTRCGEAELLRINPSGTRILAPTHRKRPVGALRFKAT